MKKILLIFFPLFCTTHLYSATTITPSMCTFVEDKKCGINLEQAPYQLSCDAPSCTSCTGTETDENTTDHYQTITQKAWTKVCDSVSYWCTCKTTVTYKCSDNYYGTVTGPDSGPTPTSVNCNACPTYATCDGGTTFKCNKNFTKNLDTCTCDGGFIIGTGTTAICNACPEYATCDGKNFKCKIGFTKNNTGCTCNGHLLNDFCATCPVNATCTDGKIICNKSFYKSNNTCKPCPHGGTTNEKGATNRSACYLPTAKTYSNNAGTFVVTENTCNAKATD